MLSLLRFSSSRVPQLSLRRFSTTPTNFVKVAVVGASGGIGQPLSLLLKHSHFISDLHLYDVVLTPGVATDLSHIETRCKVKGFLGAAQLKDALSGMDVVVIPAGVPRKPGMTRDDLFATNASIIRDVAKTAAAVCPKAILEIITNPVNSTVPIAVEVYKKAGVFDPKRILGVTTLDVVRANTFIAEAKGLDPAQVFCPIIGGHSAETMIPVFSQCRPEVSFPQGQMEALTKRIQEAGTEVIDAKKGAGSATLSMAFAAARMTFSLLRGLKGEADVIECAYVKTDMPEAPYFAMPVLLGPNGVEKTLGMGKLNGYEKELLAKALPILLQNIEKGEQFITGK